ncbi:MAG: YIP1 family protein, partial [Candidatus Pacearchaeota archaeon]
FVILLVFYLLLLIVFVSVFHLSLIIFGSKESFFNTYKVLVYVLILFFIYSLIGFIFSIIVPFDSSIINPSVLIAENSDEQFIQQIKQFFMQPGVIVNSIITLIMMVHSFIFLTISFSKIHKLSKIRAIGSVLLGLAFLIIIYIILYMVSLSPSLKG